MTSHIVVHEDGTAVLVDTLTDAKNLLEVESQNWEKGVVEAARERAEEKTVTDQERVRGRLYEVKGEVGYRFEGGHVVIE